MKSITRISVTAVAALAASAFFAASASAATATADHSGQPHGYAQQSVFVQTDNLAGNALVAYTRNADGTLTLAGTYPTGGLGGMLTGSVADHLASQGSLTYDPQHGLLYAVNAGSNTVSVFAITGNHVELRQVIASGGTFPVSIAVHDGVVYVLNALAGGSIQGYVVVHGDRLAPIPSWHRALGLNPTATPQFVNTPGQVGFTSGGTQLVVTTKANGNDIDVFNLAWSGAPSAAPVVNAEPGAVPFSFVPDGAHGLFLTEAGTDALVTFTVNPDGTVTQTASSATGQAATCWVAAAGDVLYASNAGSSTLSGFQDGASGLTALGNTATDPGTVDASASADGHYLYAQTGVNGVLDEFRINSDGTLTAIGSQSVPGAVGGEGIVAF